MAEEFRTPRSDLELQLELEKVKLEQEKVKLKQTEAESKLKDKEALIEQTKLKQTEAKSKLKDKEALIEQTKLKQTEAEALVEQTKLAQKQEETKQKQEETKQVEAQKVIEVNKRKVLELERDSRNDYEKEEARKRTKYSNDEKMIISYSDYGLESSSGYFYERCVYPYMRQISIQDLLGHENNITDAMVKIFTERFQPVMSNKSTMETRIQRIFDSSIKAFFTEFYDSTSLRYFNTSSHDCITKYRFDCSFTYKNININLNSDGEYEALRDFITCVGELKAPSEPIDKDHHVGQLCKYLNSILDFQQRQKVLGFITNLKYIQFYCLEKTNSTDGRWYYKSEALEIFTTNPESSCATTTTTQACINTDTIKILIKFLTMNPEFYGFNMLNINPNDNLYGDEFYIKTRLGSGATSNVYLLRNNDYELPYANRRSHALKISKSTKYRYRFLDEINMIEELKRLTNANTFKLFFTNILNSSPEGKFILFEDCLTPLQSMSIMEARQLIDIIEHLYSCDILHRDVRPDNVMYDSNKKHIKLIDFGYASKFEIGDVIKELDIAGVVSFANVELLETYLAGNRDEECCYIYERNFDLICAINVIMFFNSGIRAYWGKVKKDFKENIHRRMLFKWREMINKNDNYRDLLNVANDLSSVEDFVRIRVLIEQLLS